MAFNFGGTVAGEVADAGGCPSGAFAVEAGGLEFFGLKLCSSSSPCSRKAVAKRSRAHRRGSTKMACLLSSPRTCGSLFLSSSSSPSVLPTDESSSFVCVCLASAARSSSPSSCLLCSCCFLWDASKASRLLFNSEVLFSRASHIHVLHDSNVAQCSATQCETENGPQTSSN